MAEPIETPFELWGWAKGWGFQIPQWEWAILGESIGTFCRELCRNG